MKNRSIIIVIAAVILFLIIVMSIGGAVKKNNSLTIGEKYLDQYAFKAVKVEENNQNVRFDEARLLATPYGELLGLQENFLFNAVDQNIVLEKYESFDHPLHKMYKKAVDKSVEIKVYIYLLLVNDEVMGGLSTVELASEVQLYGGIYSIEGKSFEEVLGKSYEEWLLEKTIK